MRKRLREGQQFTLTGPDTMYRKLDAGLCHGSPIGAGVGLVVTLRRAFEQNAIKDDLDRVLCEATIDGLPAYGWLALGWLEPINPQRALFDVEQPSLF